jgi:hypothetical protein
MAALCTSEGFEVSALSSGDMHLHKNLANDSESTLASAGTRACSLVSNNRAECLVPGWKCNARLQQKVVAFFVVAQFASAHFLPPLPPPEL